MFVRLTGLGGGSGGCLAGCTAPIPDVADGPDEGIRGLLPPADETLSGFAVTPWVDGELQEDEGGKEVAELWTGM